MREIERKEHEKEEEKNLININFFKNERIKYEDLIETKEKKSLLGILKLCLLKYISRNMNEEIIQKI